jgi:PPOX class probable F420-dependent enzyme
MTTRYEAADQIDPEVDRLLRKQEHVVLGTLRRDGSPQASTLWYLWTGKEFILSTRPTTAKWKNLRRDPRCSLCVDDPETGQMAVAYGDAVLLEDEIEDLTRQVCAKYYDREELIEQHLSEIFEKTRSIIIVRPKSLVARRVKTRRGLSSPSENEH